jgi:uncharacterized protein YceH (UPF0502 family)
VPDDDLKSLLDVMRAENAAAHTETRRHVDVTAKETRGHVDLTARESRSHFDVTAERLEGKIAAVAESVANVNESLGRRIDGVGSRMDHGFAETQAMIKFSHAELDRRLAKLEESFADLQARVERLESTPH